MTSEIINTILSANHFYIAVLTPVIIIVLSFIFTKTAHAMWRELPWLAISWAIMYNTSYWVDDYSSLVLSPVGTLVVLITSFKYKNWTTLSAFVFTYLSFFAMDLTLGFDVLFDKMGWWYLTGIGGAGLKDGLVIFPCVTAIMVYYINLRKSGKIKFLVKYE